MIEPKTKLFLTEDGQIITAPLVDSLVGTLADVAILLVLQYPVNGTDRVTQVQLALSHEQARSLGKRLQELADEIASTKEGSTVQ